MSLLFLNFVLAYETQIILNRYSRLSIKIVNHCQQIVHPKFGVVSSIIIQKEANFNTQKNCKLTHNLLHYWLSFVLLVEASYLRFLMG